MSRSAFSQFRSALYKTQRAMGTVQAAERGGAPRVAKRLMRRAVMRTLFRMFR
jgi:hypothetical protein